MPPETRGRGRGRGRGAARGRGRGASTATPSSSTDAVSASAADADSKLPIPQIASDVAAESDQKPAANSSTSGALAPKPSRGPSAGASRFRPKNVRRDEAARDQLARQEQDKDNAKAKEEARRQARSRGRSRRSRGDVMGRGGMNRRSVASGPFSQFLEGASGRGGWGGGGGGGGGGGAGGGGSSSFFGGARGQKGEGSGGFGSAGGHREARINADRFAGLPPGQEPDSDDEATAALINANPSAVWPMGIMRIDRKEEKKALATSAELQAQEQAQGEEEIFVDGEVFSVSRPTEGDNGGVWHAAPDVPVKAEPTDDSIPNMQPIDFDAHGKHPAPDAMEIDSKTQSPATEAPPEPKLKKKSGLDPEVEMIARDMKTLLSELGPSEEGGQQRDGRLYLFQFPPVLPPLKPIDPVVKPEPVDDDDVVGVDDPANGPVDLTTVDADAGGGTKKKSKDEKLTISDMAQQLTEGGLMGKLNVRRSGKVELDWGGRVLELAPATDLNFLTKAVVVEQTDEKPKAAEHGGEAFDMGKVMGRFVLAPVWADEEDWVVDPEDLEY